MLGGVSIGCIVTEIDIGGSEVIQTDTANTDDEVTLSS